jgi:NADH-quinone oxidoreductase subunit J
MLDINVSALREGFASYLPIAAAVALLMAGGIIAVITNDYFSSAAKPVAKSRDYNNTEMLGSVLYTDYVYAFEIAAVVLLVAIVAAIALTMRPRRQSKTQRPELQIQVQRKDRVRLVDLKQEGSE